MSERKVLIENLDKVHTTALGENRIKRNLNIDCDVICYCKDEILKDSCNIYRLGKNWYCEVDNVRITINAKSYTIITAHKMS